MNLLFKNYFKQNKYGDKIERFIKKHNYLCGIALLITLPIAMLACVALITIIAISPFALLISLV